MPRNRIGQYLQATRLDRRGDISLRDELFLYREEVAAPESFLGIAFGNSHRQYEIAAELGLNQWGFVRERRNWIGHRRQLLIVDFDQLQCIERLRQRFSDDHGQRLPGVGGALLRKKRRRMDSIERFKRLEQTLPPAYFTSHADPCSAPAHLLMGAYRDDAGRS